MRFDRMLVAAMFAVLIAAQLLAAEEPDTKADTTEAIQDIAAKTADVKGFSADFALTTQVGPKKTTTQGAISFRMPDNIRMVTKTPVADTEQTTVSDGDTTWILIPAMNATAKVDMVKVRKALKDSGIEVPSQGEQHNIADPLGAVKDGTVTLDSTEQLGGHDCWVFKGQPKAGAGRMGHAAVVENMQIHVAKADGLARQIT
ncbi:MAG: LolA family protein, partial [Planctomycetota bacterium]